MQFTSFFDCILQNVLHSDADRKLNKPEIVTTLYDLSDHRRILTNPSYQSVSAKMRIFAVVESNTLSRCEILHAGWLHMLPNCHICFYHQLHSYGMMIIVKSCT
ncbi:MAG: hypothetical protein HNEKOMLI_00048 [Sodalis sp. Psp]|nr:hypothetical protein [Sodalis sp. Psp]MCR3756555.1 hypothetical protein [Sodalis sp. Ppy]